MHQDKAKIKRQIAKGQAKQQDKGKKIPTKRPQGTKGKSSKANKTVWTTRETQEGEKSNGEAHEQ